MLAVVGRRWRSDLALDGGGIQLSVGAGGHGPGRRAELVQLRPFAALPERLYLVAIATDTACLCANVAPMNRA